LNIKLKKGAKKNPPFFKITVSLSHTAIVLTPDPNDIRKMISKIMKSIVESSKSFIRWMHGTCHEVSLIENREKCKDEEDSAFISGTRLLCYRAIVHLSPTINIQQTISNAVNKSLESASKYADRYLRFEDYWKLPKEVAIEKFAAREPTWRGFDEKLEA